MRNRTIFSLCVVCSLACAVQALDLKQSVELALKSSPLVVVAQKNLDAAKAQVGQAASALIPKLTLEGGYGWSYSQPEVVNIPGLGNISLTPDQTAMAGSYSLSLSQPLFTGGKLWQAYSIAMSSYQIVNEDLKKAQNDVTYNATSAYYQVLKAEKMVELINQQISNTQKYLEQVQVFYRSGIATKADLLRVEAQLANFKQMAVKINSGLTLARLSFNSILGRDLKTEVVLDELMDVDLNIKWVNADKLILSAYQNNPDWQSFLQTEKITEAGVGLAKGGFFPDISLTGSMGSNLIDYPSIGMTQLSNWHAMIEGSWDIFNGFFNVRKVEEAQAKVASIKAREQDLRDQLELAITSAVAELQAAAEQITAVSLTADLASQSLELAQASYATQIGTNLAVLDAQTLMFQSESNLWSAKYDYQIAKAKINKGTGTAVFKL